MAQEAEKKTEAVETRVVTFKGVEYTIPDAVLEDLDALEAFEDSKYAAFVKVVLGRAQYNTFRKDNKTSTDLFALVGVLLGGDEEEDNDEE